MTVLHRLGPDGRWDAGQVVVEEPGRPAGNSVLMPLPDGRVLLFYTLAYREGAMRTNSLVHYRFLEDNGRTWGSLRKRPRSSATSAAIPAWCWRTASEAVAHLR